VGYNGGVNAVLAKRHREELLEITQVEGYGVATTSNELSWPCNKGEKAG
jgi:hypothetical protein